MTKLDFSARAFRGLGAYYAAKAHDHKHDRRYLKLFGSAEDDPDLALQQSSNDDAELLGIGTIASTWEPRTRESANGCARYNHASDFLHVLLRDLELEEDFAASDSASSCRAKR